MADSEALILFAKKPEPLKAKTRLTPPLSPQQAASLYACFLEDGLDVCRQASSVVRYLAYDPPSAQKYFAGLAPDFRRFRQQGESLGERMRHAFEQSFRQGFQRVVLIGSDLPHLPVEPINQAYETLRQGVDLVLGPSADGGYYLIGLGGMQANLFDVPMSTPQVLAQTLERSRWQGLTCRLLAENFDIDTYPDLQKLRALLAEQPAIAASRTRAWLAGWQAGEAFSG